MAEDRGVSPVVGAVLMIAIVVALSVTAAGIFLATTSDLQDPAPVLTNEESVQVTLEENSAENTLQFVHQGGQSVPVSEMSVVLSGSNGVERIPLNASAAGLDDGTWTAGERIEVDLSSGFVCQGRQSSVDVRLSYETDDGSLPLSTRTVPVERGSFRITGGSVAATTQYSADVTFLGTGWSSDVYDSPVNVTVSIGNSVAKRWTGIGDSTDAVGSYSVTTQSSGTPLAVSASGMTIEEYRQVSEDEPYDFTATGYYGGTYYYRITERGWRTTSESMNSEYLTVLRDGDEMPNFASADGQQSAAAYADQFIDDTGTIELADNQAVFLFDFNHGDAPDEVDYQDAVVLVSFFTEQSTEPGVYQSSGTETILCPAETTSGNGS